MSSNYQPPPAPYPVIVHPIHPTRMAYEYVNPASSSQTQNALVFIGGLGDGPHTVGYSRVLAQHLWSAVPDLSYSVFEVRLSTAFAGFGYNSLKHDVRQISQLVTYLRKQLGKKKIVLMGHSTGCQDCMEYAKYDENKTEPVDGFILQAPVSDRESNGQKIGAEAIERSLKIAKELIAAGKGQTVMSYEQLPEEFDVPTPVTAYRFHSLLAKGGDDDFFSSDLDDDTLAASFGRFKSPVLVLFSEEDEFMPKHIDTAALIKRWSGFCRAPGAISDLSTTIPGASHNVRQPEARKLMVDRVAKFLGNEVDRARVPRM